MVISSFADLCVRDVTASVAFYQALLDLDVLVDEGWYAELGVGSQVMVAFVESGHSTVPAAAGRRPRGVLVSFEVDDAAGVASRATSLGLTLEIDLTVELGQRHLMVRDPDGAVVDVIERVPMTGADLRRLVRLRDARAIPSHPCG